MSVFSILPVSFTPMLDAAIRSLLMALIVGLGLALFRIRNILAQKAAWTLVLAGAISLPMLTPWAQTSTWLSRRVPSVPLVSWLRTAAPWTARAAQDKSPQIQPAFQSAIVADQPLSPDTGRAAISSPATLTQDHFPTPTISTDRLAPAPPLASQAADPFRLGGLQVALLAYAIGACVLLLRLAFGIFTAVRLWTSAEPLQLNEGLNIPMTLPVRSSRFLASPVTIGTGIVLPSSYRRWNEQKLRIVLAHEASHVHQGDFYLQMVATAYAAVFWFSPLGWWLKRKLCDLSEAVSDAAAVTQASSHTSYAQVLLEFAALPRPTRFGVAMARKGRLTDRIERLLNETHFHQAFAGSHLRRAAALLLAPVALFAATALVRVEASGQAPLPPAAPPAPTEPASTPAVPPAPAAAPAPPSAAPEAPEMPELTTPPSPAAPEAPANLELQEEHSANQANTHTYSRTEIHSDKGHTLRNGSHYSSAGPGYSYSYSNNGDSYAVVRGSDKEHITFSGEWMNGRREQLDKARRLAHGDFLWFTRDGKSYLVDDPNTVAQIIAMYKPMEQLGHRQEELGRQQEELGRKQELMGNRMTQATVNKPDIQEEIQEINRAAQKLQNAKENTVTQDQISEMQSKLGELQSKLGDLQDQMGSHLGELGALQGELGEQQGKLGEQQGRLGEQQGHLAQEADKKVKSIIDQSIKDGKARPVD